MLVDGDVREVTAHRYEQLRSKKSRIKPFPASQTPTPQETQRQQQDNIQQTIEPVVVRTIFCLVQYDVLPGDHEEQVEIKPPQKQQEKIHRTLCLMVLI